MSNASKIEWLEGGASWNPVTGCTPVHSGCANCYAKAFAHRQMGPWKGREFSEVRCHTERLALPTTWQKPQRVFVCSMGDLFHHDVPDTFLDSAFAVMALCPQHEFIVLTKRPERMRHYLRDRGVSNAPWPVINGTLGVSCSTQEQVDAFVPMLLETPAANRIVSLEPLLGEVDMERGGFALHRPLTSPSGKHWPGLDGVIVGGESGPKARPCDVAWIRSIVQQCKAAGVPCFVKQFGAQPFYGGVNCGWPNEHFGARGMRLKSRKGNDMAEWPEDLRVREWHR